MSFVYTESIGNIGEETWWVRSMYLTFYFNEKEQNDRKR